MLVILSRTLLVVGLLDLVFYKFMKYFIRVDHSFYRCSSYY